MELPRTLGEVRAMFPYERWKVYQTLLELRECAHALSATRVSLAANDLDHLRRATSSAVLNLAEGAMRRSKRKKLEFYNISFASIGECNAALSILQRYHPDKRLIVYARDVCSRAHHLMTQLIASIERRPN